MAADKCAVREADKGKLALRQTVALESMAATLQRIAKILEAGAQREPPPIK